MFAHTSITCTYFRISTASSLLTYPVLSESTFSKLRFRSALQIIILLSHYSYYKCTTVHGRPQVEGKSRRSTPPPPSPGKNIYVDNLFSPHEGPFPPCGVIFSLYGGVFLFLFFFHHIVLYFIMGDLFWAPPLQKISGGAHAIVLLSGYLT